MHCLLSKRFHKSCISIRRLKFDYIKRNSHEAKGTPIPPGRLKGIQHLREPRYNKGSAFTVEERQLLGIHGLLPAKHRTQDEQAAVFLKELRNLEYNERKFYFLMDLYDRNRKLFFKVLSENVAELLPITYTPTIGNACLEFSRNFRTPRGMFITIEDKGHVYDVVKNWPEDDVRAVCVTDGERILGLGDLGANGMNIPIGKLVLYTALGGIAPQQCLPVCLDVGTNTKKILEDEHYIGLKRKRVTGKIYDEFLDEFMEAIVTRYGRNTLIQFEDFGNYNAFHLLERYRRKYCTFNDDIQGTASVTLAGLFSAMRITNKKMSENTMLFLGAGEASVGVAELACKAMQDEEITAEVARKKIWMFDIEGLVTTSRKNVEVPLKFFAKDHTPMKDFHALVKEIKPTVLIGACTVPKTFTPGILQDMAKFNERPVVFALSNPTPKAECTPQEAYDNTEGRVVYASGSPFPPVKYGGKVFHTGQSNNAYVYPGIALGVILSQIRHIRNDVFVTAAKTVANRVSDSHLQQGRLFPPLHDLKECSIMIAADLVTYAYKQGIASVYPEPKDKLEYVKSCLYDYNYKPSIPNTWKWKT